MSNIEVGSGTRIGVGFDTARYGHHVTFLRGDLQLAAAPFPFKEEAAGYARVQQAFAQLCERHGDVHFHVRIDAAGQYAANLEGWLRRLPFAMTISIGEPARNRDYCKAIFPKRKADPVESLAMARFALVENPPATPEVTPDMLALREIASRLEAQTRQSTRLANQLHNLMSRVFPELMLIAKDIQAAWVLRLLGKYPTPEQIGRARQASLTAIPHLTNDKAEAVQTAARGSIAVLRGAVAEQLTRNLVRTLRQSQADEAMLKKLLIQQYETLPTNHLDSIIGIGQATAAILTAKIIDIERFASADQLVSYFGVFPEEHSSGADKQGQPKRPGYLPMSRKGNDLVRKYLWLAASSACQHNPATRALHRRLIVRGTPNAAALGHCMRKLLVLVFAVWKTDKPFDPEHYPWENPPPRGQGANEANEVAASSRQEEVAAGHSQGTSPAKKVVTAATSTVDASNTPVKAPPNFVDFAALRDQVGMEQVLTSIGFLGELRGGAHQRRGRCPLHTSPGDRRRTFSVNLRKNVFQCFDPNCAAHGNVLDFWATLHRLPLVEAARHLATTFHLTTDTEKRNP